MLNHHHHHHQKNLSPQMEKFPRDLLQRFIMSSGGSDDNKQTHQEHLHHQQQQQQQQQQQHPEEEQEDEEVELNLGLSLGGRFGVDKHAKKLMRSSSVVGTMPLHREEDAAAYLPPAAHPILMRTSSLPTETEEQWRKRKELQTLRRMEAKRRRSEKQRVSKLERDGGGSSGGSMEEVEGAASATMGLNRLGSSKVSPPPPFGLASWAIGPRQVNLGDVLGKGKSGVGSFQGLLATQPSSQGSVDSQGGSSSSVSEMESKPFLGSSSGAEARSTASNQSLQEQSSHEALGSSGTNKTNENMTAGAEVEENLPSSKKPHHPTRNNAGREIGTNLLGDMPCVFTKGDGPNGKRIEGILYRYGKGEEVRIMCVCHGRFLSPAQFVEHAGGSDVANPLKHIVVNPSAAPFL